MGNAEADISAELDSSAVQHYDLTVCDVSGDDLEASYEELDAPWCMSSNAEDESVAEATPSKDSNGDVQLQMRPSVSPACSEAQESNDKCNEHAVDTFDAINCSAVSTIAESDVAGLSGTSFASCAPADWSVLTQDSASNLSFLGAVSGEAESWQ